MKTIIIILASLILLSCSDSSSEDVTIERTYYFKAELFKERIEMETSTGRVYRTINTHVVLLEKYNVRSSELPMLKEVYDRGVLVDLEIRDPGDLTIQTTNTYKVTIK